MIVPKPPRSPGMDVARCLAILSMVYVNFEVVLAGGVDEPRWLRNVASAFEGNASATFVMLAGMGIVLLGRHGVILRRALLLLVVGYLWQLLWPGDILHYYAFYLSVGAVFLATRVRWLWLLAAVSVGGWMAMFQFVDYGAGWRWMDLSYPEFWSPLGQVRNLAFNGWHPLLPWLAFLFGGMALAKWGLAEVRQRRVALLSSAVAYAAAFFASQQLSTLPDERPLWTQLSRWYGAPEAFWGMDSIPPGPLYVLSAGAASVFLIAACFELTASPTIARWTRPLARCGQLALTFYLAHVLFLFFAVAPLGEWLAEAEVSSAASDPASLALTGANDDSLVFAAVFSAIFGVLAMLFASLWLRRFKRGPLEWLMRRLCG